MQVPTSHIQLYPMVIPCSSIASIALVEPSGCEVLPNHSLKPTRSGLRPPRAA